MAVQYQRFVRSVLTDAEEAELAHVDGVAQALLRDLDQTSSEIARAHVVGAQSKVIQNLVAAVLEHVGFDQEVVLTPQDGFVTQARADLVYSLGTGRGVIAEVERGGAVNNNHDLKDMWKAHIASDAQHLFLVVPVSNWTKAGQPREKPFKRVVHRFKSFFGDPRRELDVVSCHVFGYGDLTMYEELQPEA